MNLEVKEPKYIQCVGCGGSGCQIGLQYVEDCDDCGGDGTVRNRDTKGRFV